MEGRIVILGQRNYVFVLASYLLTTSYDYTAKWRLETFNLLCESVRLQTPLPSDWVALYLE